MDAPYEAAEPIPAEHDEEPWYHPNGWYDRVRDDGYSVKRPFVAEADSTSPEELQAKYERLDEVHVGPLGAPVAPSSRQPSAPVLAGGRRAGGGEELPAADQPAEPVAIVAVVAAPNGEEEEGEIALLPAPSDVKEGSEEGRSPSMSFSDWTDEEYEDYLRREEEAEDDEEEEEEEEEHEE